MASRQECTKRFRRLVAVVGVMASGLLASAPASAALLLRLVAYDQAKVDRDLERCQDRAAGNPTEIQACDDRAFNAALRAVPRSPANEEYQKLLQDLFEPLLFARTGGEDSLAERDVVTGAFEEFAGLRARILTGQNPQLRPQPTAPTPGSSFSWVSDRKAAARLEERWARIKIADCAAYAVASCEQRLEQALGQTVTRLASRRTRGR